MMTNVRGTPSYTTSRDTEIDWQRRNVKQLSSKCCISARPLPSADNAWLKIFNMKPSNVPLSSSEKDFLLQGIKSRKVRERFNFFIERVIFLKAFYGVSLWKQRLDGRETYDYRKLRISFGVDQGHCEVQLGRTRWENSDNHIDAYLTSYHTLRRRDLLCSLKS